MDSWPAVKEYFQRCHASRRAGASGCNSYHVLPLIKLGGRNHQLHFLLTVRRIVLWKGLLASKKRIPLV
jgi:hypothetical protein